MYQMDDCPAMGNCCYLKDEEDSRSTDYKIAFVHKRINMHYKIRSAPHLLFKLRSRIRQLRLSPSNLSMSWKRVHCWQNL